MSRRYCQRGMTLLEILVALTIFVLMAGAAYIGLQQALVIQNGLELNRQFWRRLDTVMILVQQDLGQARDLSQRIPLDATQAFTGTGEANLAAQGELMQFSRGGHASYSKEPVSPHVRVAYRLRDKTLYRVVWPRLNMPEDQQGIESVLMDGIKDVQVQYLDTVRQWNTDWPGLLRRETATALPTAVRLIVEMDDGRAYERVFHVGAAG